MTWISGRTLSPASEEMVFWISEDAGLPPSQNWEQLWQVCSGIEPIVMKFQYADQLRAMVSTAKDSILLLPAAHLLDAAEAAVPYTEVAAADIDPDSRCESHRRTVSISVVNFDINDDGESVCETTCTVGNASATLAIRLKMRGRNPSRDALDAAFPDDMHRAIGWQESTWRHFLPNGKPKSNTNSNGTKDWGLMQINQASNEEAWNWKLNLNRGMAILAEKRHHATVHLSRHPPFSAEMLDNETLQRYNGGKYYIWDPDTESWMARPPNGYVAMIRNHMESRPWARGPRTESADGASSSGSAGTVKRRKQRLR